VLKKRKGKLILIGGRLDIERGSKRSILKEVARQANEKNGRVVLITVASQFPKEVVDQYVSAFRDVGVREVLVSSLRTREDAHDDSIVEEISTADVIFFTGGDQLRISSQLGNTPVLECLKKVYEQGGTVAGTSAGAAVMPETMLIGGKDDKTNTISAIGMAPGLGLVEGVVIDSHFAERGRF
jgi:cyanophycinase